VVLPVPLCVFAIFTCDVIEWQGMLVTHWNRPGRTQGSGIGPFLLSQRLNQFWFGGSDPGTVLRFFSRWDRFHFWVC
jgi:hypothetical protein